jgi:glucose-6-phosphate isomerase
MVKMTDNTSKHYASRTHEKMREVLMDPDASGPAVHYHMVRGGTDQKNITVWEPGKVGEEYIKTYGHYHVGNLDETYWVLYGEGIAIVQKRTTGPDGQPIDDQIEGIYAVWVKAGDLLYMPAGWGHLVANIGQTFLVTADDSPVNFEEVDPVSLPGHADYEAVKKMRGFAYYVVGKDGKPSLVKNPLYKQVPETELIEVKDYPLKEGA